MTALERVRDARTTLTIREIFFGAQALRLKLSEAKCGTAQTDGKEIRVDPRWIETLSHENIVFVLAHEVMHVALKHHLRRGSRDPRRWNKACDQVIHSLLRKAGWTFPEGAFYRAELEGLSEEQVYERLKGEDEERGEDEEGEAGGEEEGESEEGESEEGESEEGESEEGESGEGESGEGESEEDEPDETSWGEVVDYKGSDAEKEIESQEVDVAVQQAQALSKACGKGAPDAIDRIVDCSKERPQSWESIIEQWASRTLHEDYAWHVPDETFAPTDLYLPTLESEGVGSVAMLFDTSCSMSEEELNSAAQVAQRIFSQYNLSSLCVYCDSRVRGSEFFTPEDYPAELHLKGGGGTSYRPAFEFLENGQDDVEEGDLAGIIYFTDGECFNFPDHAPNCPVLWVLTGGDAASAEYFNPPFGEVDVIDADALGDEDE